MNIIVSILERLPILLSGVIDLLFLSLVGWVGSLIRVKFSDIEKRVSEWMNSRSFIAQQKILTVQQAII